MAILANDVFTNIAQATISSGGTTAPAAGSTETWTASVVLGTFPAAQNTASAPTQFRVMDPALDYSEVSMVTNVTGGANMLSANASDLETSVADWSAGSNTTLADSFGQAHTGTEACRMTATASGGVSMITATDYAVTAATNYVFAGWIWSPVATTATLELDWRNSSHSFIGFSSQTYTVPANTWTPMVMTATSVALSAFAVAIISTTATGAGQQFYADTISLRGPQTWSVTRGVDGTTPVVHTAGFTANEVISAGWLKSAGESFGSHEGVTPDGCLAETMDRSMITNSSAVLTTILLYMFAVYIPIGTKISAVNFYTGTTASSGQTHSWWGLADSAGKQQAHTVDGTSTQIGGTGVATLESHSFVTPYTTTYSGVHYVLQSITAPTQMPTQQGSSAGFTGVTAGTGFTAGTAACAPLWGSSASSGATPGTDGTTTYTLPVTAGGVAPKYFYLT